MVGVVDWFGMPVEPEYPRPTFRIVEAEPEPIDCVALGWAPEP